MIEWVSVAPASGSLATCVATAVLFSATEALVAMLETALASGERPAGLAAYADDLSWERPLQRAAARVELPVQVEGLPVPAAGGIDLLAGRAAAGRRMLNLFGYTGSFSVYAAAGGAVSARL